MPAPKGNNHNPKGRPKGTPNVATTEIKLAFAKLLEAQGPQINKWMNEIAAEDPAKAMDLLLRISERFVPALSRTELTGAEGKDIFDSIIINFNTADPKDGDKD